MDPLNSSIATFISGGKFGFIDLSRTVNPWQGGGNGSDESADNVRALFSQEAGSPWYFNPLYSSPASGTCMVYTGTGDFMRSTPPPGTAPGTELNAGSSNLSVTGASGSGSAANLDGTGLFDGVLGVTGFDGTTGEIPSGLSPAILATGPISVSGGSAGAQVGVFQASSSAVAPLSWTNRDQIAAVDRSQPLTLAWSGGDPATDTVYIGGVNADLPSNASAGFLCAVPKGVQSFTVPAYVLSSLPPTRLARVPGALVLTVLPAAGLANFSASGLDAGYVVFGASIRKTITVQ